jgi:hypothetical protein
MGNYESVAINFLLINPWGHDDKVEQWRARADRNHSIALKN